LTESIPAALADLAETRIRSRAHVANTIDTAGAMPMALA